MPRFKVMHLPDGRLAETLPLARMSDPPLTLERWRRFARWLRRSGGGILAAFAGDDRPHGLAAYRIVETLAHGRALHVEPMVTFEIARSAPARAALFQALELLAMGRGCDAVIVSAGIRGYADPRSAKANSWAVLGLELISVALVKRVEVTGPAALPKRKTRKVPAKGAPAQGDSRAGAG